MSDHPWSATAEAWIRIKLYLDQLPVQEVEAICIVATIYLKERRVTTAEQNRKQFPLPQVQPLITHQAKVMSALPGRLADLSVKSGLLTPTISRILNRLKNAGLAGRKSDGVWFRKE